MASIRLASDRAGAVFEAMLFSTAMFFLSLLAGPSWTRVHALPPGVAIFSVYLASRMLRQPDTSFHAPDGDDIACAVATGALVWLAWLLYGAMLLDPVLEPALGWIASAALALVAALSFVEKIQITWLWALLAAALAVPRLPHVFLGLGIAGISARVLVFIGVNVVLTFYCSGDAPARRVMRTIVLLFAEHWLASLVCGLAIVVYVIVSAIATLSLALPDTTPRPASGLISSASAAAMPLQSLALPRDTGRQASQGAADVSAAERGMAPPGATAQARGRAAAPAQPPSGDTQPPYTDMSAGIEALLAGLERAKRGNGAG